MPNLSATAVASPNIAFIKYWGNRDQALRIPANGSISMNLAGLVARTRVEFDHRHDHDVLWINGQEITGLALQRVELFLNLVRELAGQKLYAQVISTADFPAEAGLASSAAAFAALTLAATHALGFNLSEQELSRLARRGSGSACRSIPTGFVEWQAGSGDQDSFAFSIASPDYWDLVDCIAVVSHGSKPVGSSEGHSLAWTSPLQQARLADTPRRLDICRQAIRQRDFGALAEVVELDSNLMHAVMLTSLPALFYWMPATLTVIKAVSSWRRAGAPVCYTVDAGPNVHVLCPSDVQALVQLQLNQLPGVESVLVASPGSGARLIDELQGS
jgi:diphosphomevalonate decarboxylase